MIGHRHRLLDALVLIVVATVVVPLTPLSAAEGKGGCFGMTVSSPQLPGATQSFSATKAIDLELSVLFTQGDAKRYSRKDHIVEFNVFTPKGSLYQSTRIPFSNDPSFKGQSVPVSGYPKPVAVQVLNKKALGKGFYEAATITLPVAGTPIINNSLFGQWRAEAFVEGERLPCSKPVEFTITQ